MTRARVRPALTHGPVEVALEEYRLEINSFRAVVKAQREAHYFLCYFTMREIILLWSMLREQQLVASPGPRPGLRQSATRWPSAPPPPTAAPAPVHELATKSEGRVFYFFKKIYRRLD